MAKSNANAPSNPAAPASAANPSAPIPNAGTEPATQATAAMATDPGTTGGTARPADPVLPPAPYDDYDMPDDYDADWLGQTRQWVEQNPVLAIAAAAGIGLVVGRIVTALLPEPEPPSFAERVEKRAKQLRKDAAVYADDAGEVLAVNLKKAANALSDAAEVVADKAETGYERSKDLAEVVADAVKAAVAGVVVKKADNWISRIRN